MTIPEGKKRYYLTLEQEGMERVQELVSALKLPRQTVSLVFDEYLRGSLIPRLESILEKKRAGQQLSFADLFISLGESNLVIDGEHRGEIVQFHVENVTDDGTMIVTPRSIDQEKDDEK